MDEGSNNKYDGFAPTCVAAITWGGVLVLAEACVHEEEEEAAEEEEEEAAEEEVEEVVDEVKLLVVD
ncbi:MAG: hypothetical protein ACREBS_02940 [Nitrososphaerales archaeon]